MREHDVLVFILSLAVLLSSARLLGELARRLGFPLIFGELASGILLGPTVMGRAAPLAQHWLFPPSGVPQNMLAGYTNVAVVLLLVVAGLEVNLGVVRRRGRSALLTSLMGIAMPLAGGALLGVLLPDSDLVQPQHRLLFALFMGVALSISALPVIAKTLLDLGLFKTDVGLLVMAAAMVDDLAGWIAFSVLLGPMQGGPMNLGAMLRAVGLTVGFVTAALLVARPVLGRIVTRLQADQHTGPRRVLSMMVLLSLFGASFTQWVGIHAVFGGFVVGVVFGDTKLKEHTRTIVHDFVTNIFAPVFFASLGLRADFVASFDFRLCALVFLIASVAKVGGCTVGARMGGLRWRPAAAVGFGLNARGAMEIILALLALEAGLLREKVFVALVVMALLTSLISGPTMKAMLRGMDDEDLATLLRRGVWLERLKATTASAAIEELTGALSFALGDLQTAAVHAVLEREATASTSLGHAVAVPHSVVADLGRPLLAIGLSPEGVDFNAPDGESTKIIFLLLVPPRAHDQEVRILAQIARAVIEPSARSRFLDAHSLDEVVALVSRDRARPDFTNEASDHEPRGAPRASR